MSDFGFRVPDPVSRNPKSDIRRGLSRLRYPAAGMAIVLGRRCGRLRRVDDDLPSHPAVQRTVKRHFARLIEFQRDTSASSQQTGGEAAIVDYDVMHNLVGVVYREWVLGTWVTAFAAGTVTRHLFGVRIANRDSNRLLAASLAIPGLGCALLLPITIQLPFALMCGRLLVSADELPCKWHSAQVPLFAGAVAKDPSGR